MTEIKNIYQRLHKCMESLEYIKKEKVNTHQRYKFTDHDSVTAAVRREFVSNGIVVVPSIIDHSKEIVQQAKGPAFMTTANVKVRFINIDDPTDYFESFAPGYGIDKTDLGPGKAFSYAVKMIYLKVLALETGERDNEEDANSETEVQQQPKPDPVREAFARIRDNLEKLEPEKLSDYWDENIKHILAMPEAGQAALQAIYDKRSPKGGDEGAPF